MNDIEKEAIKTDSNTSIMRIAFWYSVKLTTWLTSLTVIAEIIGPFVYHFIDPQGHYSIDLVGLAALIGTISVSSFGGKAAQSFGESRSQTSIQKQDPRSGE